MLSAAFLVGRGGREGSRAGHGIVVLFLVHLSVYAVHHNIFVEHVFLSFSFINAGVGCLFVIEVESSKRDLSSAFDDETRGHASIYSIFE